MEENKKTNKAKVIILVVVGVLLLVIGGVFLLTGNNNTSDKTDTETQESKKEDKDIVHYWLKDGLNGVSKKDISGIKLYNVVSDGQSLESILRMEGYTVFQFKEETGSTTFKTFNNIDEVINYVGDKGDFKVKPNRGIVVRLKKAEKDYASEIEINVYNLSEQEVTVAECIAQNNFAIVDEDADDVFDNIEGGYEKYESSEMDKLVDMLGKPSNIYLMSVSEGMTAKEKVEEGDGFLNYNMVYEYGKGKLILTVNDWSLYVSQNVIKSIMVTYVTNDVYEYGKKNLTDDFVMYDTSYEYTDF